VAENGNSRLGQAAQVIDNVLVAGIPWANEHGAEKSGVLLTEKIQEGASDCTKDNVAWC
jgi:hypothetical protein